MTTTENTKFDRILDLEDAVRISQAVQAFQMAGVSDYRAGQVQTAKAAAKSRLFAAIDALTEAELTAFGEYRKAARA